MSDEKTTIRPSGQEAPRSTTRKKKPGLVETARRIHNVPTKLGWSMLAGLIFLAFAIFVIFSLISGASRDAKQVQKDNAIRTYTLQLDNYKDQIEAYAVCVRTVRARDDLRAAIFGLDDGLIKLADNAGLDEVTETLQAQRDEFDEGYPALSMDSCKLPEAPTRPSEIPEDVLFIVPTIPQ